MWHWQEHGLVFVSDETLTDTAAAAAEPSSEPDPSSVKKPSSHPPAALLSTEIYDVLQGYPGTLGELILRPSCHRQLQNIHFELHHLFAEFTT